MSTPNNQDRAARAEAALAAYTVGCAFIEDAITDLMTDLLHFAHQSELDLEALVDRAQMHFEEEVHEEAST